MSRTASITNCCSRARGPGLFMMVWVMAILPLSGCATLRYYGQAVHGELSLLSERRPLNKLIANPATPASLRQKLELAQQIRRFASAQLGLPENGSYTSYVALGRPYVSWDVFGAPPFSLKPITWCFLFAGCVPYRGYFSPQRAKGFAARLHRKGNDVYVSGVPAFSTLGWFDDPLVSSMLDWNDTTLATFIFHELAHQELYVYGDADFNESYAVLVADVGVRRWLLASGREAELAQYETGQQHWRMIVQLVDTARGELTQLYASGATAQIMRAHKQLIFDQLRRSYQALRPELDGDIGYDNFFDGPLNNASLLIFSTYTRWLPAFRALLAEDNDDLATFYPAVRQLGRLPAKLRCAALEKLMVKSAAHPNP